MIKFTGRSSSRSHVQNAPKPVSKAPPPAPVSNARGQSLMGTLGANVVHAITWGFGASVRQRVGEFIFGPHTVHVEHIPTTAVQSTSNTSGTGKHVFAPYAGLLEVASHKCCFRF